MTAYKLDGLEYLEKNAKRFLDRSIYNYIAGLTHNDELTPKQNCFDKYRIVPRMLQNVSNIKTSVKLFGKEISTPVIIGPSAFHKLVCNDGELATAQAAANANTIMTLSTMSTYSLEEVAKATNSPKWFQLYIHKNRSITEELVHRAEEAGYCALVLTVDMPAMGIRLRKSRNQLTFPIGMIAANFKGKALSLLSNSRINKDSDGQFDPSLTWEIIDWLASKTRLPILLKGILHPMDALLALNHKVAGIIVSNHGGRQIDSAISSIDALSAIAKVTQERIPLLVDGNIRSGEDIFKAIALGASAVLIARPVMWALAIDGKSGVDYVLQQLQEELRLILCLSGCSSLDLVRQQGSSLLAIT